MTTGYLQVVSAQELPVPADPHPFLRQLGGATAIEWRVAGAREWLVVSVLVHGNEPSGFFALHRLLRDDFQPALNTAFVVSSVRPALSEPPFTARHLPGEYDLNRRFGCPHTGDPVTDLARDVAAYIREKDPYWLVDIHNTSGRGPAFGVSVSDTPAVRQLVAAFSDRMIVTHLVVGSLMEQNFNCPVVTIECGGAQDPAAHDCARLGLRRLLTSPWLNGHSPSLALYQHPVRVELRSAQPLRFANSAVVDEGLVLRADIEQLNSQPSPAGTPFGWTHTPLAQLLTVINDQRQDVAADLFAVQDGVLINRVPLQIFMATPRADIARSDCLFYAA